MAFIFLSSWYFILHKDHAFLPLKDQIILSIHVSFVIASMVCLKATCSSVYDSVVYSIYNVFYPLLFDISAF